MSMLQTWIGLTLAAIATTHAAIASGQAPSPAEKPVPSAGDAVVASSAEYDGWKVYHSYCDRCHGQDVTGSSFAPNLRQSVGANGMSEAAFSSVVLDGRPEKGMPPFKATISDAQAGQLYAYVKARAAGTLPPGRPKRSS